MWEICKRITRCKNCGTYMPRGSRRYANLERSGHWRHNVYYCRACAESVLGKNFNQSDIEKLFQSQTPPKPVEVRICSICGRDMAENLLAQHMREYHNIKPGRMIRLS